MENVGLPHSIENEDIFLSGGDEITQKNFSIFLVKALVFNVVSAVVCIIYTIYRENGRNLMLVFMGTVSLWTFILIWSISLPVVSPNRGRSGSAFWTAIILLPPLSVVLVPAIDHAKSDECCEDPGETVSKFLSFGFAACFVLLAAYVLRYIQLRLKAFYNHDYDKLRSVAMQCIDSTLRTGVLQIAVLTTALVAYGGRREAEIFNSAYRLKRNEDNLKRVEELEDGDVYCKQLPDDIDSFSEYAKAWYEHFTQRNETGNNQTRYCYTDAESVAWYALNFKDKDEQDTSDSLRGLQAGWAGLAFNIFLFQALMARHVLKLGLIDVLKGRMTWIEFLLALLQLIMVIAVAVLLTFSPIDFINAFSLVDWEDSAEFWQRRLVMWQLFGLIGPIMLSLLLHLFFAKALQDDTSATGHIFRERHRRVPKVEYQILKGEEQHAALKDSLEKGLKDHKQALEGHKNQMGDSLTDLESKISSLGDEIQQQATQTEFRMSSLGNEIQKQADRMEQSFQGQLKDGSLADLEGRISTLGTEKVQEDSQTEQSHLPGKHDGTLTDPVRRISSLDDETQQDVEDYSKSPKGCLHESLLMEPELRIPPLEILKWEMGNHIEDGDILLNIDG